MDDETTLEYWIVGIDISEADASKQPCEIRLGLGGERIIWCDDINPK